MATTMTTTTLTTVNHSSDIIWDTIGEWGQWQKRTVFLVFLCKIVSCWCMAIVIFTAPTPRPISVRCYSNNVIRSSDSEYLLADGNNFNQTTELQTVMHPETIVSTDKFFDIDFCHVEHDIEAHINRYSSNTSGMDESEDALASVRVPCDIFKHKPFYYMKETSFDWICSRNLLAAFAQFFFLFGVLVGGIVAWQLLNIVSPKNLLFCGMLCQIGSGLALAFIDNYKLHLLLRFLNSVSCAQMFTSGQVLLLDIVGTQHLRFLMPLFETFWSLGVISLPLIAYFLQTWKSLFLAVSLPTVVYVAVWIWIADSPRWHLRKGNITRVIELISDASIVNNNKSCLLPDDFIEGLQPNRFACRQNVHSCKWIDLWQCNQNFVNIVCIHLVWAATVTAFNGMLLNTRNFGSEYLHWNVMLTGFSELFGVLLANIFVIGNARKWLWAGLLNIIVGVTVLFVILAIAEPLGKIRLCVIAVNFALKAAVSITYTLIISSTVDLIGPQQRRTLIMSCTIWARMCLLTASFIGSLALFATYLPLAVFAVITCTSGLAMCVINPTLVNIHHKRTSRIELEEIEKLNR